MSLSSSIFVNPNFYSTGLPVAVDRQRPPTTIYDAQLSWKDGEANILRPERPLQSIPPILTDFPGTFHTASAQYRLLPACRTSFGGKRTNGRKGPSMVDREGFHARLRIPQFFDSEGRPDPHKADKVAVPFVNPYTKKVVYPYQGESMTRPPTILKSCPSTKINRATDCKFDTGLDGYESDNFFESTLGHHL